MEKPSAEGLSALLFGGLSTAGLSKILKSPKDILSILKENKEFITTPTLKSHLEELLSSKGMKRQDVIKRAELDGNYANQLFNGIKTKPGRDQVLSLSFGFMLDKDEADRLLRVAGLGAMYSKNMRDAVIIHALENGNPITQTNEVLASLELETLSDHTK